MSDLLLQRWRGLAAGVLRKSGIDVGDDEVERELGTTTYDGIMLAPVHVGTPGAGMDPSARGRSTGGWDVRQRHAFPHATETRAAVRTDLDGGVTSLWLVLGPAGLPLPGLAVAVQDVPLTRTPVVLDAGDQGARAAHAFLGLARARQVPPRRLAGNLGLDSGADGVDPAEAVALATTCAADHPLLRAYTVDGLVNHEAGASDAQEIGWSVAAAVGHLRAMTTAGLPVADAFGQIDFRYAVGADQFAGIAKLRAARQIWNRVAELSGVPGTGPQRQHAVTSAVMMTRRDPWVNLLRTTLGCFAAAAGGADAITVQPYDAALGLPVEQARRLARNTHALLVHEAHLARVADPAGGSWYVEQRTRDLAVAAWDVFQQTEAAGGYLAALETGLVAAGCRQTRSRREADLHHRRTPITGVSEYVAPAESPVTRVPAPPPRRPVHRHATPFERLRDRADAAPHRPTVFLALLGPAAAHAPYVAFATGLFATGGVATTAVPVSDDPAATIDAFTTSGARVACIAGTPTDHYTVGERVAKALADAGAVRVWSVGRTGAGDDRLHPGCDAVAALTVTLRDLGVPE